MQKVLKTTGQKVYLQESLISDKGKKVQSWGVNYRRVLVEHTPEQKLKSKNLASVQIIHHSKIISEEEYHKSKTA